MAHNRTIAQSHFGDNARIHQGDVNNYHSCSRDDQQQCLLDLRVTDPQNDKTRIEESKGGLLQDSYRWILGHEDFQRWQQPNSAHRFLWIKGDPGKGKTMLLCGIIDELNKGPDDLSPIVFFFCQATDSRINTATSVLRGLIYMLIKAQPTLFTHIWKEYKHAGKQLFEDWNAFATLSTILTAMVKSPELDRGVIIIDALDECVVDLEHLLKLIVKLSEYGVRWIVSSRNWLEINALRDAMQNTVLCLELNESSISEAVHSFIAYKARVLAQRKPLDGDTEKSVEDYLKSNCNNTFLWVALVCSDDRDGCKQILKIALTVYRPHRLIFSQCLVVLTRTLKRNIYGLDYPGFPIEEVESPRPDPLTPIRYLCTYWGRHLHDFSLPKGFNAFGSNSPANKFLRKNLLNWLEALCLLKSLQIALRDLKLLQRLLEGVSRNQPRDEENEFLLDLIRDALRFIPYFKPAIEAAPLQVYASGLTFSPKRSLVRMTYKSSSSDHDETFQWKIFRSSMQSYWSTRIQTIDLDGYETWLAATEDDFLVCSTRNGNLTLQRATETGSVKLGSHPGRMVLGVYSTDCTRFASLSSADQITIWDLKEGALLKTLNIPVDHHSDTRSNTLGMAMIFTAGNSMLVLALNELVGIWDIEQGLFSPKLNLGQSTSACGTYRALDLSGTRLAVIELPWTVDIRDLTRNTVVRHFSLRSFMNLSNFVPMAFSHDGNKLLIIGVNVLSILNLDQEEDVHVVFVTRLCGTPVFTRSGRIALPCVDGVQLWGTDGMHLHTLNTPTVSQIMFSADETQMAYSRNNGLCTGVVIQDVALSASSAAKEKSTCTVSYSAISTDGRRLATVAPGHVDVWNTRSARCIRCIELPGISEYSVKFSNDLRWIAAPEQGRFIHIWDSWGSEAAVKIPWPVPSNRVIRLGFSHHGQNVIAIWAVSARGIVDVDRMLSLEQGLSPEGVDPCFDGYHLSSDGQWIMKEKKRIIWIPHGFQDPPPQVAGNVIVLIHERGGFMRFL
ncbi:hypothetical protein FSARC_9317 [Fusarium sarcochroum]|uniref:NACHT domain-containing protein n=1 Tax=Fusarium sarcochroum TaxID=1208366 RepID=A0A8H4TRE7_9HYPO|nr:hypothetical protein FSARC_9317 [Fusarium sarcochroum]